MIGAVDHDAGRAAVGAHLAEGDLLISHGLLKPVIRAGSMPENERGSRPRNAHETREPRWNGVARNV